ncbi:MAG: hypothetical protein JST27_03530 [Bacteroidetes bacterium]|nr:hypothetical protein [Bacteroidota bacterium]
MTSNIKRECRGIPFASFRWQKHIALIGLMATVLSATSIDAGAQVLLLDIKLGECVTCRSNIYLLDTGKTHIPTYAVFETRYQNRRGYLDSDYHLDELGITMLFNDSLKKMIGRHPFSTVVLMRGDSVLFSEPVARLSVGMATKIRDLAAASLSTYISEDEYVVTADATRLLSYNYTFNECWIKRERDSSRLTLGTHEIERTCLQSECFDSKAFATYVSLLQTKPEYAPVITDFGQWDGTQLYGMAKWYSADERHHLMHQVNGVAIYRGGKIVALYPIVFPSGDATHMLKGNILMPLPNDEIVLCFTPISVSKVDGASNRFLTVFKRRNNCYYFSRFLSATLPLPYRQAYGANYLSFFARDERFVLPFASNEIVDIWDDKTYPVPLDLIEPLGKANLDSAMSGIPQPICNVSLAHKNHTLFAMTRLNGVNFFYSYSLEDKSITNAFALATIFHNISRAIFNINATHNCIYIRESSGKMRVYPFGMLYTQVGWQHQHPR